MRSKTKKIVISLVVIVVLLGGYSAYTLLRAVPLTHPISTNIVAPSAASQLVWPLVGQAAVGIVGSKDVTTHGIQTPVPTASVAKLITSLVVLKAKPLSVGDSGPTITLTANDVAIYNQYVSEQGSVVPVVAGEAITEDQMLEAMLLPSANNMADSLAIWAYGSLAAYSQAANSFLAQVGLTETHVGSDASGYDPSTTSTAHDLVLLGELALQNPVIAQIVSQPSVIGIPLTTSIRNVNSLLGTDGIIGIKTGNTNQAGGVYVSASVTTVNNKPVTIVTALASAPTLSTALSASVPFIESTHRNFQTQTIAKAGTIVGSYGLPWGTRVPVITTQDLTVTAWNDSPVSLNTYLKSGTDSTRADQTIGTLSAEQLPVLGRQNVDLQLGQPITKPDVWWRLSHPW
jgi:D-alanyl-D-alanine carboxypeptidase (penicillin-binding protein 5/6)